MRGQYILDSDGKTPVPEEDLLTWAMWLQNAPNRSVKRTELPGNILVSTIFLGLDFLFPFFHQQPLLFETMIFGGEHHLYNKKYCTWDEAEAGHDAAIQMIFEIA